VDLGSQELDTSWSERTTASKVQDHQTATLSAIDFALQLIVLASEAQIASLYILVVDLVMVAAPDIVFTTPGTHTLLKSLVNVLSISTHKVAT
jgi:hypothetical protein